MIIEVLGRERVNVAGKKWNAIVVPLESRVGWPCTICSVMVRAASALALHAQFLRSSMTQSVNFPDGCADPTVQKSTSRCDVSARKRKRSADSILPLH